MVTAMGFIRLGSKKRAPGVFMYVFVCMCVYVCGGKHFFFRREHQAVEAHRQAILPATAPRTANPEGKPQTEGKPQAFKGSPL